jgi:predicted enzyme related to lactoylglutathione lyase
VLAHHVLMSDLTQRANAESFRARELAASLTVNDLAASLAWYRDVIGFTVDREHQRDGKLLAVSLKAGDVKLLIGQDNGAKGFDRVKGEGFSLQFSTAQDIDELAAAIKSRGGVLDAEPTDVFGARVFRLLDPDGFKLVISSVNPCRIVAGTTQWCSSSGDRHADSMHRLQHQTVRRRQPAARVAFRAQRP